MKNAGRTNYVGYCFVKPGIRRFVVRAANRRARRQLKAELRRVAATREWDAEYSTRLPRGGRGEGVDRILA